MQCILVIIIANHDLNMDCLEFVENG